MSEKVISFCLFFNGQNPSYFGYLYGMLCNAIRINQFLPGWEMRVYTEPKVLKYQVFTRILKKCKELNKYFRLVFIDDYESKFNCLMSRYLPIFDPNVSFVAVRDTDSIIGILDIFFIKMFSHLKNRIFCVYREKNMIELSSMGGGFCCNCNRYRTILGLEIPWTQNLTNWPGRREIWFNDEPFLHQMMKSVPREQILCIPTRMKEDGGYYLFYGEHSSDYHRLWFEINTAAASMIPRKEKIRSKTIVTSMLNRMMASMILSEVNPQLFINFLVSVTRGIEKNGLLFYAR